MFDYTKKNSRMLSIYKFDTPENKYEVMFMKKNNSETSFSHIIMWGVVINGKTIYDFKTNENIIKDVSDTLFSIIEDYFFCLQDKNVENYLVANYVSQSESDNNTKINYTIKKLKEVYGKDNCFFENNSIIVKIS